MFTFCIFKFDVFLEVIKFFSPLNSAKGRFVGALRGIDYSGMFLIKTWIKSYPLTAMATGMMVFICLCGYIVYIAEREIHSDLLATCYESDSDQIEITFPNALYMSIIAFLTVGYGDFYPVTQIGRLINIITAIGGLVYSATIIGMVHDHLSLSAEE